MRRVALVCVAICVWLCAAPAARATEPFASGPVWGATFLSYPVGVRNIGMGASGTADVNSLSTGYFNPASVAFAKATTILGSYENQFLDTGLYDTRITSPIPFHSDSTTSTWHLAGSIGYTVLDIPAQTERTIFLPEGTGRTIDENDWMLSALGAASWSHGVMSFAAGGTTKMIQSAFSGPTIWSFDVGILAAFPITMNNGGRFRPRLGYSALNLDTGASDGSREVFVQTEKRGGFGFDLETPPVAVFEQSVPSARFSFDYDLIDRQGDSTTKYAVGFELAIVNMVSFRYGLIDDNYKTYGAGVGWDYGRALFRLDYAHTDRSENNTPLFLSGQNLDRDAFGAILGVRW